MAFLILVTFFLDSEYLLKFMKSVLLQRTKYPLRRSVQFLKISIPPSPKDVSGDFEGSQNAKRLKESLTGISRGGGGGK